MYKTKGVILFSPTRTIIKDHISDPCWCIVQLDDEFSKYYQYVCKKIYNNIKLQTPKWGPHITVIRNEFLGENYDWKSLDRKEIEVVYNNKIENNGKHYWMPIINNEIYYEIRNNMGIFTEPEFNFHLTFGVTT